VVLNLGGFANATWLAPGREPVGFDTGPAGALLDGLARALLGTPLDRGGAAARRGSAHAGLLAELLTHPFFERGAPRSTGRDTFGARWVGQVEARVRALGLAPEDALATGVACVAESVAGALRSALGPELEACRGLVLCGGGAHNLALIGELERRTGLRVASSAEHGVDPKARESIVFALLAVRCVLARPATEPGLTGALPGGVLGAIHLPPYPVRDGAGPDSAARGVSVAGGVDKL
jgi:anhydro-N-acetylmuramic acid kinase